MRDFRGVVLARFWSTPPARMGSHFPIDTIGIRAVVTQHEREMDYRAVVGGGSGSTPINAPGRCCRKSVCSSAVSKS
jgi:hypothetical protein